MSSNEDEYDGDNGTSTSHGTKKRRIQRACDICRRKKIRCDGVQMPGNRCSNCITYSFACTYVEVAKKRAPAKGYVENLETRLEKLEKLLQKLSPDVNLLEELDENLDIASDSKVPPRHSSSLPSSAQSMSEMSFISNSGYTSPNIRTQVGPSVIGKVGSLMVPEKNSRDDNSPIVLEDHMPTLLTDQMEQMSLEDSTKRFFGKSSIALLIKTSLEVKQEYVGEDVPMPEVLARKRPEFWDVRPWELSHHKPPRPKYEFPEQDLIHDLTDLYFKKCNLLLPFLHRPSFERSVEEGLHLESDGFGAVMLLVCAVGARYSDDPRVLLEDTDSSHSSGWKWFEQVKIAKKSLLTPPSLHDLQFYCVYIQFLSFTSTPQSSWTIIGFGIRLALEVGAHRRKISSVPTVENELWKRAFWTLIWMDRLMSTGLGRPCCIQDEDFDLDMPIECDDEYWEHPDPEKRFKQPPGKPSLITFFNLYLRLSEMLGFSLRTIYSINKSKILLGLVGPRWEQPIVAELDSALNKWVDSIPDHLRWDPTRENNNFFQQSVVLYTSYYHLQILIHRPFIPSSSKPSPLSFPSLAICTNAARSCSHVVDIWRRRDFVPVSFVLMPVFTSAIVLLLNVWGANRSGLSIDSKKEMVEVYNCMKVLQKSEKLCNSAGLLWDLLNGLTCVGDLPLPQPSVPITNKRERYAERPIPTPITSSASSNHPFEGRRSMAGSRRVQKDPMTTSASFGNSQPGASSQPSPHQQQQPPPLPEGNIPAQQTYYSEPLPELFPLPVYSDELGRLPPYEKTHFSYQAHPSLESDGHWYPPATNSDSSSHSRGPESASSVHAPHPHAHVIDGFSREFPMDESHMMHDATAWGYPSGLYGSSMGGLGLVGSFRSGEASGDMAESSGHHHHHSNRMFDMAHQQQQEYMDSDTLAMFSNAPTGFELHEWGTYLTNVGELAQEHHGGPGSNQHSQGNVE